LTAVASSGAADILWLDHPDSTDVASVGAKAAHLSRLAALGSVPPGFSLTAGARARTGSALHLSPELRASLARAYAGLAAMTGAETPRVAVRSSAIDEDGPLASFAGQHETYLNISGVEAVVAAVERCWASARSEHALTYRRQHGLPLDDIRLSVLVQQLVPADVSAVMFSANPVSGRRDEIVVTASWGLGESIVGGTVTPDSWVVSKDTLAIVDRRPGDKRRMTVAVDGGTREVDVPRLLAKQPSLTDEQVIEMAVLSLQLERQMGWPVDVESAWAQRHHYLLQCRPITALGRTSGLEDDRLEPAA
jgi:pyruvate,water dikinase